MFKIKYWAKRAKKKRKYSILGIKIIGSWPLDSLVICPAKMNSNCLHKGKEKIVCGGEKSNISVKHRLANLLERRPPPLPPRYLRPWHVSLNVPHMSKTNRNKKVSQYLEFYRERSILIYLKFTSKLPILWNYLASEKCISKQETTHYFDQTSQEWSLGGPLSKLFKPFQLVA